MSSDKPAHIQLRDTDIKSTDWPTDESAPDDIETAIRQYPFETAGQRAAAEALLRYWEDVLGNFAELERRTDWSRAHFRNVYSDFFEPADVDETDLVRGDEGLSDAARQWYRDGYRDGFADGYQKGRRDADRD